jgi:hypothetical protein
VLCGRGASQLCGWPLMTLLMTSDGLLIASDDPPHDL